MEDPEEQKQAPVVAPQPVPLTADELFEPVDEAEIKPITFAPLPNALANNPDFQELLSVMNTDSTP